MEHCSAVWPDARRPLRRNMHPMLFWQSGFTFVGSNLNAFGAEAWLQSGFFGGLGSPGFRLKPPRMREGFDPAHTEQLEDRQSGMTLGLKIITGRLPQAIFGKAVTERTEEK